MMQSSSTQSLPPSTSCKDTSNFDDYKFNEVKFHHKTAVVGTDLGIVVDGIAMKFKSGEGYAYTGSAKGGWKLIDKFISFADTKRLF